MLTTQTFSTPLGNMTAYFDDEVLSLLSFTPQENSTSVLAPETLQLQKAIEQYCQGKDDSLLSLPSHLKAKTPFQQKVLETLKQKVGIGVTITYKELGELVGSSSARAVGTALARNPLPLFYPCHRVIRSDGSYGEYAGGSEAKELLLTAENSF